MSEREKERRSQGHSVFAALASEAAEAANTSPQRRRLSAPRRPSLLGSRGRASSPWGAKPHGPGSPASESPDGSFSHGGASRAPGVPWRRPSAVALPPPNAPAGAEAPGDARARRPSRRPKKASITSLARSTSQLLQDAPAWDGPRDASDSQRSGGGGAGDERCAEQNLSA